MEMSDLPEPLRAKVKQPRDRGLMDDRDCADFMAGVFTLGRKDGRLVIPRVGHDPGCPAVPARDLRACTCPEPWLFIVGQGEAWAECGNGWERQA